jgi:hypothetical protein
MGNFVRPARVYDFTAFSRRTPAQQLPGDRVDAQFTAHADAIAELQAALGRPVGFERLDPEVVAGLTTELVQRFEARLEAFAARAAAAAEAAREAQAAAEAARQASLRAVSEVAARLPLLEGRAAELKLEVEARLAELRELEAAAQGAVGGDLEGTPIYYGAGGPYAADVRGATSTSADYAQVSIEWAEHMPDTIPPNILAINAISGDHWSSRWWANRAAGIVAGSSGIMGSIPAGQGVFAEPVAITAPNVCAPLSHTPNGPVLLVVNGVSILPVGVTPPFTMTGKTINWFSSIYSLIPGQTEVAAWYPFTPP